MKILEGWARGLPVVATSVAAAGLGAVDGRDLLVGETAQEFGDAVVRVAEDASLADRLVSGGRRRLLERHDPAGWDERCSELYFSRRNSEPL